MHTASSNPYAGAVTFHEGYAPWYVWVESINFGHVGAYFQSVMLLPGGKGFMTVRLEVDESNETFQQAVAEGCDDPEFIEIVPIELVRIENNTRTYRESGWYRKALNDVLAMEEEARAKEYSARMEAAERRVRDRRLRLPELDAGLRG